MDPLVSMTSIAVLESCLTVANDTVVEAPPMLALSDRVSRLAPV